MASVVWVIRFTNVDLPTFGRPTTATIGSAMGASLLHSMRVGGRFVQPAEQSRGVTGYQTHIPT